jgi:DNA-3-methyladenine glycosylase
VLERDFYNRDTSLVAKELIGKWLVHKENGSNLRARIVETEAYLGLSDPASHLASGFTKRTSNIWGHPGRAYVFLCYGIHACLNAITVDWEPYGCVLIRAVEPVDSDGDGKYCEIKTRSDGPGRLTRALGIDLAHNGKDLTRDCIQIWNPADEQSKTPPEIQITTRVGISKAKDMRLRYFDSNSVHVSKTPRIH